MLELDLQNLELGLNRQTIVLAVLVALLLVKSFSVILTQIFTILVIGLGFDILNTWIMNVGILKYFLEKKK